jgi:Cadherin-like domain/Domain of unknown function (DUF4114)
MTRIIQTAPGDGELKVVIDEYGNFSSGDAKYDPIGPLASASTTYRSYVALGIIGTGNTTAGRTQIANVAGSNGTFVSSNDTTANSTFTLNGLQFQLKQNTQDALNGDRTRAGGRLDQVYRITNTTTEAINFDLVRYVDGDLLFDGSLIDGGGRFAQDGQEVLFETDRGGRQSDTTFFGITGIGGTTPVTNRWELDNFASLSEHILAGNSLQNKIVLGDANGDQFIDSGAEYDVALALRSVFSLAPGASTSYATSTRFGSGVLEQLDIVPPTGGVGVLPATTIGKNINVTWTATDPIGVKNYDVYVSINGGAFNPWQTDVTTTSAIYTGEIGNTYAFYSLATDNSGNEQAAGDALTTSTQLINPITLDVTPGIVGESGTSNLVYTFSRNAFSTDPLVVTYTIGGTATATNDYVQSGATDFGATTGTVTFAAGATTATVTIDPTADSNIESNETVSLTLVSGSDYNIATPETVVGYFIDQNDGTSNIAPVAVSFRNTKLTLAENTNTTSHLKIADVVVTDDNLGTNVLSLSGADAANFELAGNALFIKAGTTLDFETKAGFNVTVSVNDAAVGATPDASADFALALTNVNEAPVGSPTTVLPNTVQASPVNISTASLLAGFSDVDAGTVLTVTNLIANNGALVNNNNGTFTLTPTPDFSGILNLTYGVSDGAINLPGQIRSFTINPAAAVIAPATNAGLLQLSQGAGTVSSLRISKLSHLSPNRNELGVFAVDDANGTVNGVAPGQVGYVTEALKRSQVIFSTLTDSAVDAALDGQSARTVNVPVGSQLGFYLTVNNVADASPSAFETIFSFPTVLNTFQNAKFTTQPSGAVQLAWEDTSGGGDQDFNDLVVQIENAATPAPLGSQPTGREILNLTTAPATTRATFTVGREAGYNNHIGFYKIEDASGTIKVGNNLIKVTDDGYRQAIVQNRIAGIDLTGTNGQTLTSSGDFQGGALYAPFLIADSASGNLDFSNVYTAFRLGNADATDHVRLLGDNTFGFEDLYRGGDRDFNDIIVKAVFQ